MSPTVREILRFVAIGFAFGVVWAAVQYINGQVRDPAALAGPVIVFAVMGVVMWGLRQIVLRLRNR